MMKLGVRDHGSRPWERLLSTGVSRGGKRPERKPQPEEQAVLHRNGHLRVVVRVALHAGHMDQLQHRLDGLGWVWEVDGFKLL